MTEKEMLTEIGTKRIFEGISFQHSKMNSFIDTQLK